jgi:hypothetical protein
VSIETLRERDKTVGAVRRHLRLDACPALESRFELVRATVWSIAAPSHKAHVHRVISTALQTWQLLSERSLTSEETLRAELRGALSTLEDAGDLIGLSGGYWAPAATRFVKLPDAAGYLLIGGVPSALLQFDTDAIKFHGPHRHLASVPADLTGALPFEDFDSWTGRPERVTLQEWAREIFTSFERSPYTPSTADIFEFYLPASSKPWTPQFFRWSESAGKVTGTLLARRRRLYGAREYRLVDVREGRIAKACELHGVDVRRLMYALDLETCKPVRARARRVGEQTEWLFTSELPRAEQRAFSAFGTLTTPNERRFERKWTFTRNEELALDMLRSLGIELGQTPPKDGQ